MFSSPNEFFLKQVLTDKVLRDSIGSITFFFVLLINIFSLDFTI